MAFQPTGESVQANLRLSFAGQQCEYVLNVGKPGGIGPSELGLIATKVNGLWAELRPLHSNQVSGVEVYVIDTQEESGLTFTSTAIAGQLGGETAPALPNSVAFCVTHRTSNRGRSFRGRTYLTGLCETQVDGNVVTPAYASAAVTAFETFKADLESDGYYFAVVSRRNNGALRPVAISTSVIASIARDRRVDSQRRRLPGNGS